MDSEVATSSTTGEARVARAGEANRPSKRTRSPRGKKPRPAAGGTGVPSVHRPEACATARKREAILVVGMHRSGTSALTRVLGLCGATLPKHLMAARPNSNAWGFWESQPIYEAHERIFAGLGTSWDDPADLPRDFFESALAAEVADELWRLVEQEFESAPAAIIKDPRLCRLVPLWIEALRRGDLEPRFVLPIRNPLEVARSLHARDGMSVHQGLVLWLRHVISAERDTRSHPRAFVRYEHLLTDWRAVVERISRETGVRFPRRTARAAAEIDAFLVEEGRHHRFDDGQVRARRDVIEWVKTAYEWFLEACSTDVPPMHRPEACAPAPAPAILDEIDRDLTRAEEAFGPIVAVNRLHYEQWRDKARTIRRDAEQLQSKLHEQRTEACRLENEVAHASRLLAEHQNHARRLVSDLEHCADGPALVEWTHEAALWVARIADNGFDGGRRLESAPSINSPNGAGSNETPPQHAVRRLALLTAAPTVPLDEHERECGRLNERIEAEAQGRRRAEQEHDQLRALLNQIRAELTTAQHRLETAQRAAEEAAAQRDAAKARQAEEHARVQHVLGQLSELRTARDERDAALANARQERDKAQAQSREHRLAIESLRRQVERLSASLNQTAEEGRVKDVAIREREALIDVQKRMISDMQSSFLWRWCRRWQALVAIGRAAAPAPAAPPPLPAAPAPSSDEIVGADQEQSSR